MKYKIEYQEKVNFSLASKTQTDLDKVPSLAFIFARENLGKCSFKNNETWDNLRKYHLDI